jgi:hypothetical protein
VAPPGGCFMGVLRSTHDEPAIACNQYFQSLFRSLGPAYRIWFLSLLRRYAAHRETCHCAHPGQERASIDLVIQHGLLSLDQKFSIGTVIPIAIQPL